MEEIELVSVNKSYTSGNAKITVFIEPFEECPSFEKVTFKIKYDDGLWPEDGLLKFLLRDYYHHFYFFLVNSGTFVYDINDSLLDAVEVYYYNLNHKNPLVVGFASLGKATAYFSFDELRNSKVSSVIGDSFSRSELPNLLISLNAIINSKIRFFQSEGTNRGIKSMFEFVGVFKVVIYTPDLGQGFSEHRLFSNNLFDKYKSFNKIGSDMLSRLSSKDFNSIHVYYTYDRRVSLMVDFIDDCRKYQFLRVGEDSWDFQAFDDFETDEQLVLKLSNLYRGLKFKVSRPISHGHVLLDVMDIDGVEVTRVRRFSYRGLYLGLFFGFVFFLSFLLLYFLLANYEFIGPFLRIRI
ncbi:hypothetical protein TOT_030000854 [Theileria orientalis strain Shintoku]|uniref:Uncharacterized protein n=1 Tax=Theileria orientalis strain Shintoku TaxID=869250 RepID=J4C454_THEOR|nr:hypothetical protein TOT_030000854 [Theileria orientalis strain Shintoku]PVC54573.1 hypothetical protein MACL_00002995 [Theileria orientalis]BAM41591.1 hypothetical protein TOT_030000854 [Theileria orientalis strain Shintoku]|eukprot:XP_009691892.1 hypothetical protein TOT_030000854 [Theileria orientalis strain Shintoku]